MPKKKETKTSVPSAIEDRLTTLLRHYEWGRSDTDTRRVRKNGWNEIINAYMGILPANWPYNSIVSIPLIRTTILEKTSRLVNAKLQGRLVPRDEDGDYVKAKINNALLDFQWDSANDGGSMVEKIALADQYARLFGASWVLNYWDLTKNSNEIKVIDPRDIWFDGAANNIRNCKWVQVREWTTLDKLEERGYDVSKARAMAEKGELPPQQKSTAWQSVVKGNRGLMDRTGQIDDLQNPVVQVITEWGYDRKQNPYCTIFLPTFTMILSDKTGNQFPYKHGKIPISMLRYYPLLDDIYGESEVEPVLPLQRAANAMVDGFLDEANIVGRPPLKVAAQGVRIETIEYGPGARWIMNDPNLVQEHQFGQGFISTFNSVYPMVIQAFNTAMGDQSMGIAFNPTANQAPAFGDKTATEVRSLTQQQNNRDQYNQLYLSEFLKEIMMMWLSNNKQYLFDDPTKKTHILKIIGKDQIQELQAMGLDEKDIPTYAANEIAQTVMAHPEAVSDSQLQQIVSDVSVPTHPVVMNPTDKPEEYDVRPKLEVSDNNMEAKLYMTPEDFEGEFDYIPDVKSMSAGAGQALQNARNQAIQYALNPQVMAMLQTQGDMLDIKEILINTFEDAGYKDAECLFKQINNGQPNTTGQATIGAGQPTIGNPITSGVPINAIQNGGAVNPGLSNQGGLPNQNMGAISA